MNGNRSCTYLQKGAMMYRAPSDGMAQWLCDIACSMDDYSCITAAPIGSLVHRAGHENSVLPQRDYRAVDSIQCTYTAPAK